MTSDSIRDAREVLDELLALEGEVDDAIAQVRISPVLSALLPSSSEV